MAGDCRIGQKTERLKPKVVLCKFALRANIYHILLQRRALYKTLTLCLKVWRVGRGERRG